MKNLHNNSIQKGVPLYNFIPDDEAKDRILLSSGVCSAAPYSTDKIQYAQNAYLPLPPWRSPTKEEEYSLFTKEVPRNHSSSIGIIRIPTEILAQFKELKLNQSPNQSEFYSLIEAPQAKNAVRNVENFISSFLVRKDNIRTIIVFNSPGLDFTAYSPQLKRYMGLHVDYLYQQSIFNRENSANRISINLGLEERHLAYVNLTMNNLITILNPPSNCSNDEIVARFFEKFPDYPVVKVKILPGEAYIAPTQNIIHDGIGAKNTPDFHLTICGHISLLGIDNYLNTQP